MHEEFQYPECMASKFYHFCPAHRTSLVSFSSSIECIIPAIQSYFLLNCCSQCHILIEQRWKLNHHLASTFWLIFKIYGHKVEKQMFKVPLDSTWFLGIPDQRWTGDLKVQSHFNLISDDTVPGCWTTSFSQNVIDLIPPWFWGQNILNPSFWFFSQEFLSVFVCGRCEVWKGQEEFWMGLLARHHFLLDGPSFFYC